MNLIIIKDSKSRKELLTKLATPNNFVSVLPSLIYSLSLSKNSWQFSTALQMLRRCTLLVNDGDDSCAPNLSQYNTNLNEEKQKYFSAYHLK